MTNQRQPSDPTTTEQIVADRIRAQIEKQMRRTLADALCYSRPLRASEMTIDGQYTVGPATDEAQPC